MSKDEEKRLSRRGFLRGSAAVAGAAATGGTSAVVPAGAIAKSGTVGLFNFKILDALVKAVEGMDTIIGKSANTDLSDLQSSLRGQLILPRFPPDDNEYWDKIQNNRIDFSSHKKLLEALKSLPSDKPLAEILSDSVLQETVGKGSEDFATNPAVKKAMDLRKIIDPLCNSETTSSDLIGGFKGYFVKLAEHAIKQPQDFAIDPAISDPFGWEPYKIENIAIRERRWGHDDRGSYDFVAGRNDIGDIIDVLESYVKNDETLEPLLSELKKANDTWELENKEKCVKESNERREKRRQEQKVDEEKERAEKLAKEKAENDKYKRQREKELLERKLDPSKRSKYRLCLKHLHGERYLITRDNCSMQADWYQWAQSANPEAKMCDVLLEEGGHTVIIKNIPDNEAVLRTLFRKSTGNGEFAVELPNINARDLNDTPARTVTTAPYSNPSILLELNVESQTTNATEVLSGANILDIDFSRDSDLGMKDDLTGLNLISGMKEELTGKGRAVGGYHTDKDNVTVMHINMKDFRRFNEQYGHKIGNIILQEVAARISKAVGYDTVIGRVGGDRIAVIYYGDPKSVEDFKSDMMKKINEASAIVFANLKGEMESVGVEANFQKMETLDTPKNSRNSGLRLVAA